MLRKLLFFVPALLLWSCSNENLEQIPVPEPETEKINEDAIVPGVLVVKLSDKLVDNVQSDEQAVLESLGASAMDRVFPDAGKFEARHRKAGLHKWYRLSFDESVPATKAARRIGDIEGVECVDYEMRTEPTATRIPFDDPYNYIQWNLYNDGTRVKGFKKGMDINVLPVWEEFTSGSSEVIVAVVDNGVDINHEDLAGVVIPGTEDGGSRCFVYGYEGSVLSADAHGTHVSSIIGGINNNAKGLSSIAGGRNGEGGVKIIACQMMMEDPEVSGNTLQGNSAAAIVWGADNGAVISQNSWSYGKDAPTISKYDAEAIEYFIANAGFDENGNQVGPMAGGVVFFAAGNDNQNSCYPAEYESVIAVGALGPDGKKAGYSNYGDWVDIAAPGGDFDRFSTSEALIAGAAYGDYIFMAGTSQACPHVSGVAALLVSHFGGPGFTNEELLDKLLYGADYSVTSESDNIGPKLNAYGSFLVEELSDPVIVPEFEGDVVLKSHESAELKFKVQYMGDYELEYKFDGGSEAAKGLAKGDEYVISIDALAVAPGTYSAKLSVSIGPGHGDEIIVPYTILENHSPKVVKETDDIIVEDNSVLNIDLSEYVGDEDGEELSYMVSSSVNRIVSASVSGNILSLKPSAFGTTKISIEAKDARGKGCSLPEFRFVYCDLSKGPSAYPNPVTDYLKVSAGKEKELKITITNSNGAVLFSQSLNGSELNPARIDMREFAPGRYGLTVSYDGTTSSKTIVKAL